MSRSLFPEVVAMLHKDLDLRFARHALLSANLANAETPGYIARDLRFEDALRAAVLGQTSALHRTHPRHLPLAPPPVQEVKGTVVATPSDDVGRDLNTVSVEREMGRLTVNAFRYGATAEILSRLLAQLRRVIQEGRI
ncbi:MAG: flagellar basal body rod protein FlgB [Candidatus Tectimicrobiota bacterium]|nr:MAG: flagellar basal body rod protein FlgB [Candidatus Tectomicrobia bacterium]